MAISTRHGGFEVFSTPDDVLGEGPLWSTSDQALYWVDIASKTLYRKTLADSQRQGWALPDYPGGLAELTSGAIAVATGEGVQRLDLQSNALDLLRAAPPQRPGTRFNEGKVDPRGRFWVGTMQNNFGPNDTQVAIDRTDGVLYRFDPDGSVHTIEEEIGISNTLAWSPDLKRFYFADSLRGPIYVYDYDADSGSVSNKRIHFDPSGYGVPDGSAIDSDGCLWNARWGGGLILRITPDGRLDRRIEVPALNPTSCIFGGPDLRTLYVTSAKLAVPAAKLEEFPLSGAVFAIELEAQGMPVPPLTWTSSAQG